MKVWLRDLPEGQEVWYIFGYDIHKSSKVGETRIQQVMTRMPLIEMANGDTLAANHYAYTEREEAVVELKKELQSVINIKTSHIETEKKQLKELKKKLKGLK